MKKVLALVLSLMMVFSIIPVTAVAATQITHTQFLAATDRYEKFIERNNDTPHYVMSDNQRLTMSDYLYVAAGAIVDLANGQSISVNYKEITSMSEYNYRENLTAGEILRGEYVALAKAVVAQLDSTGKLPNCFGTSLGAISPKNLGWSFAKAIQYYSANRTLPASIEVAPWVGTRYDVLPKDPDPQTPEVTTVSASQFVNAAIRVKDYIETNAALPSSTLVDGNLLTMGQFFATALDAYIANATSGQFNVVYANNPKYPVENMASALVFNKAQLDAFITAVDNATGTKAPASVSYNGSVVGFNTLVYTIASALAEVRNNGEIASFTVSSWKDISGTALPLPGTEPTETPVDPDAPRTYSFNAVAVAANYVLKHFTGTDPKDLDYMRDGKMFSTYVSFELTRVSSAEAFLTFANVVKDLSALSTIDASYESKLYDGLKAANFTSKEAFKTGAVAKADYINVAEQVLAYAEANGNMVPESTTCALGTLGYESTMILLASAVSEAFKNYALPASVELSMTWSERTGSSIATPVPTEAPATEAPTPTPDNSITIAELAQAAKTALASYTEGSTFYKNGLTVDGATVAQPSYYIMAAQAIQDIYNNKTTATYKVADYNYKVPTLVANYSLAQNGTVPTTATQAFYMNYAIRQTVYVTTGAGSTTGAAGASASYPTTTSNANGFPVTDYAGQMTYEAALVMFTRILAYYADNNSLPTSVALAYVPATDPDGVFTTQEVLQAATKAVQYYEEGTPFYKEGVVVDGVTLAQQDYAMLLAYVLKDIHAGNSEATYNRANFNYNVPTLVANYTLTQNGSTPTTATKNFYLNYALRQVAYVTTGNGASTGAPPASCSYPNSSNSLSATEYSGQMTYEAGLLVMSRALDSYRMNGTLPASVPMAYVPAAEATEAPATPTPAPTPTPSQSGDGIVTIAELAQAAQTALAGYTSGNAFYTSGLTVDGLTMAQQNYYIMAAQAIQDIYNNKTDAQYKSSDYNYKVPTLVANYTLEQNGSTPTTATQAFYMNFAIRQTVYVTTGGGASTGAAGASAAYPTTTSNANGFAVSDYEGQMTYEAALLMFTRVLAHYAANGTLPTSVALEYVPAVDPTEAPATTEEPATPAPYPTQYPTLSTNLTSGTSTFTVKQIAQAASIIVSHYETYKALETNYSMPKAVTIGNYTIKDQDWAYMAGYAVCGLSGEYSASGVSGYTANTQVTYKAMGAANVNANNTYTAGSTFTMAQVAEAAWKCCSNYGNNNGRVAASCGSMTSINRAQVSYYTIVMLMARTLAYYDANGALPSTVQFDKLNFKTADSDTYVAAP